jgi:methylglutaconyl-CoA hydratase
MPDALLLIEQRGAVQRLTLNRPDQRNALSRALVDALQQALDATPPGVRVVVLTGAGSAFSAGADLASLQAMQTATAEDNLDDSRALSDLFQTIVTHRCPVVAQVNGAAIGGGCGLVAACDLSVVARDARLGFPEVRLGFVPAIVLPFVVRKVGQGRARDLLLRGAFFSPDDALAAGFVTRVVEAGDLEAEVDRLAGELVAHTSATALALTKQLFHVTDGLAPDAAARHATLANAFTRSTADMAAGLQAFLGKTDPPWRQRAHSTDATLDDR